MQTFNEKSALTFDFAIRDRTGAATYGTTLEYTLRNLTADETAIAWTSVTPASDVTVNLSAQYVTIDDDSNARELYELTVVSDRGLSTEISQRVRFYVRNLSART